LSVGFHRKICSLSSAAISPGALRNENEHSPIAQHGAGRGISQLCSRCNAPSSISDGIGSFKLWPHCLGHVRKRIKYVAGVEFMNRSSM
jgi:hypothetical protein